MRASFIVGALFLAACGSQVVLFPEDSGVVDSGDAGHNRPDTGNLTDTNKTVDVVSDTGSSSDTGTGDASDGATEDANDASDGATQDANDGATEDAFDAADASDSFDSGSDTNDPCANVVCPEAEVCQNGVCVCDGHPQSDAGCDDNCGFDKALLCHYPPGNPGNEHNICVGEPSVKAHLAHGDKLGCCQ